MPFGPTLSRRPARLVQTVILWKKVTAAWKAASSAADLSLVWRDVLQQMARILKNKRFIKKNDKIT